ncbi:predicted protein [Naegleria gruberi]|uniref:Apolipoprotein D n=1 Tax=Naegleria gruberi TaxID=5762 RepID=D2VGT2_NAEGR|nr:uncharacterized protein NAEGRDRAFT_68087 [Naegleria gruberi]EFC44116.1 predicted protein [Naegleria gruberi]|eukprot:XP_002676860.1 predicted protein [Naegleria gruberi strain NEG-M]
MRSLTILLIIFYIFYLFNSSVNGQLGKCQRVNTKQDFKLDNYLGVWYEIARFDSSFEKNGICSKANYTINPSDSSKIIVTNSEYINGQYSQAIGEAYCPHPEQDPAKLLVSFGHQPFAGPYWVVDTDYKTYSMVFSCVNILGVYHIEYAWILARQPSLNTNLLTDIMSRWKSLDVDISKFKLTKQVNCQQP